MEPASLWLLLADVRRRVKRADKSAEPDEFFRRLRLPIILIFKKELSPGGGWFLFSYFPMAGIKKQFTIRLRIKY